MLCVCAATTASVIDVVGQIRSSDGWIRAPSPLLAGSEPHSATSFADSSAFDAARLLPLNSPSVGREQHLPAAEHQQMTTVT
jgi:hypothetical protein